MLNNELSPEINAEVEKLVTAVLKGALEGAGNILQILIHPVDNLLHPVSVLLFDAAVIATANDDLLGSSLGYKIGEAQYQQSILRTKQFISGLERGVDGFLRAPFDKKLQHVSEQATTLLIPGAGVKSIRAIATGFKNFEKFGTFRYPRAFHNSQGGFLQNFTLNFFSKEHIASITGYQKYSYIITLDNRLLIHPKTLPSKIFTGNGNRLEFICNHAELAGYEAVYGAGEAIFIKGELQSITNYSGHYKPTNTKVVVEKAFKDAGYPIIDKEGRSKYCELFSHDIAISSRQSLLEQGKLMTISGLLATTSLKGITQRRDNYELMKRNIPFPLPSRPIIIPGNSTPGETLLAIDKYFVDIIQVFSRATKDLLALMYFDNLNVIVKDVSKKRRKIDAQMQWTENSECITGILVSLDPDIAKDIFASKLCKIHELVHVGQLLDLVSKLGFKFVHENVDFYDKLTEFSAAVAEKLILDAIPIRQLGNCPSSIYDDSRKHSFTDYITLNYFRKPHVNRYGFTSKDHEEFLEIPEIDEFIKTKFSKVAEDSYRHDRQIKAEKAEAKRQSRLLELEKQLESAKAEAELREKERVEALAASKRANKILAEAELKEAMLKIHTESEARIDVLCANFISRGKEFTDGIERVFKGCREATKLYEEATAGYQEVTRIWEQYSQEVKAKEADAEAQKSLAQAAAAGTRTVVGNLRPNPNPSNVGNYGSSSATSHDHDSSRDKNAVAPGHVNGVAPSTGRGVMGIKFGPRVSGNRPHDFKPYEYTGPRDSKDGGSSFSYDKDAGGFSVPCGARSNSPRKW